MRNDRIIIKNSMLACVVWTFLTLLSACTDMHSPELHAYGKTQLNVQVEIDAEMEALGYTVPESYHIDIYDAASGEWVNERNMMGNSASLYLNYGWYHMLFYNNDTQLLRLQYGEGKRCLTASTETYPYISLPDTLKQKLDVKQMPDLLYATYRENIHISDNLADYTYLPEQNAYVLVLEARLRPLVYIYQIEVELLHNAGQVIGSDYLTVTGLASSVDVFNGQRRGTEVAHQVSSVFKDSEETQLGASFIKGKLQTFGQYANIAGQTAQNLIC